MSWKVNSTSLISLSKARKTQENVRKEQPPTQVWGPLEGSVHSSLSNTENEKCKPSWSPPPRTKGGWCILVTANFWQINGLGSRRACKVPSCSKLEATYSKGNKDHICRGDEETWKPLASS